MKNMLLAIILSATTISAVFNSSQALGATDVCKEVKHKLYCGSGTTGKIVYSGDVVLDGTTVLGAMIVTGNLAMQNANVNSMHIIGNLSALNSNFKNTSIIDGNVILMNDIIQDNMKILGNANINNTEFLTTATINGNIQTRGTIFKGMLALASDIAYLSHTTTSNIYFIPTKKIQKAYFDNNTYVDGNVSFSSMTGTVYLNDHSKVTGLVNTTVKYASYDDDAASQA